jgi:hypothetical protein
MRAGAYLAWLLVMGSPRLEPGDCGGGVLGGSYGTGSQGEANIGGGSAMESLPSRCGGGGL